MNGKIRYVNRVLRKALALHCYDIVVCRLYNCDNVKVYACRKHLAVVMVGMVAANLGTSGSRK